MALKRKTPPLPPESDRPLIDKVRDLIVREIENGFTEVPPHGWQLTRSPEQIADIVLARLKDSLNNAQDQLNRFEHQVSVANMQADIADKEATKAKTERSEAVARAVTIKNEARASIFDMMNRTEDVLLELRVQVNQAAAEPSLRASKHRARALTIRSNIDDSLEALRDERHTIP